MSPEPRFLRLFVAVALPADVKAALCDLQRELKKVLPPFSVAWTRPEGMHLTLRFLGSVGESHVPELERSLRGRLEGFGPLDLVCERVGCFPDRRFPRVVWAGVHDAAGRLPKVHELVNQAAEGFAEKPAEPHFVGHATVGRPKHVRRPDAAALARFVDASIRRRFGAWRCGEIELVRSDPSPTGSRYTTIATIALDAAAPGHDEGARPSARPAYRLLDHTADLAFEVEGADWAGLLGAATAALGDVVLADDGRPTDVEVRRRRRGRGSRGRARGVALGRRGGVRGPRPRAPRCALRATDRPRSPRRDPRATHGSADRAPRPRREGGHVP